MSENPAQPASPVSENAIACEPLRVRLSVADTQSMPSHLPWQLTFHQLPLPLIHERPVDSTGAEIGHVKIRFKPSNRLIDQPIVFPEHRSVAGQKPLDIARADSLEGLDK